MPTVCTTDAFLAQNLSALAFVRDVGMHVIQIGNLDMTSKWSEGKPVSCTSVFGPGEVIGKLPTVLTSGDRRIL